MKGRDAERPFYRTYSLDGQDFASSDFSTEGAGGGDGSRSICAG